MTRLTGLLTAAAAAALLSLSPVAAQQASGTGDNANPATEAQLGINQDERLEMTETFRTLRPSPITVAFDATVGAMVPDTIVTQPVPPEIVAVAPATEGYHYFALPDGRIALVDAQSHQVVDILE